jgi:anthranilate phosphoribosyltransferase
VTRSVLTGEAQGVERSLVLLNAGAALYVGGVSDSIKTGVSDAAEAIDAGAAGELLARYVERTKALAPA